jgi:hypothetical protein
MKIFSAITITAHIVLHLVTPYCASAQPTTGGIANKKFSIAVLKEDFDSLTNKLKSSQPGLYLYTSKDSLNKIFAGIRNSITEPMTSLEFYQRIAPLNRILRNLHTRFWPPAAEEKTLGENLSRFPFDIYWNNNRIYILRNHTNENVPLGSVLNKINGETSEKVFQRILDCRLRDGFNESYPISQASRNFSFYYAQLIGTPETFTVEFTTPEGTTNEMKVKGMSGIEIEKSRITKYKRKYYDHSEDWDSWIANKEPALQLEIKEDIAIMRVRIFYLPDIEANGQNYREFFTKSFSQMITNKTKNLIIDLRNNHGGTDAVGMELLSHLHDSSLYYYKRRSNLIKPKAKARKNGNVYEVIGRGVWTGKVVPAKEIFKGQVYVLMNGYCVSAAAEFIGHLKNIGHTIFIGEETGGNPVAFTGGKSLPIDLAHSRVTGSIPLQFVEMNVRLKNTGHGVIPDYEIRPDIKDILDGRDVEMELALKLIAKKN